MGTITLVRHGQANSAAQDEAGYDKLSDLGHQQALWLGEWIAAQDGWDRLPHLFGWSMGSTISQLAIQRHPDVASSLTLFGYWRDVDVDLPADEPDIVPLEETNTAEAAASDFITPGSISDAAVAAYVVAVTVATVALFPGWISMMIGGLLFGLWPGLLYALVGITAGAFGAFHAGRALGRSWVEKRMGDSLKLQALDEAVSSGR